MGKNLKTKHPEMKLVKVIFPDGESIEVPMSSKGYEKAELHLQSDPRLHRAWLGKGQSLADIKGVRAQELRKKYPSIKL